MLRIILITGGQSSGKSLYAERRALELSPGPVYVATARAEGMEERIERHKARRGAEWTLVEEPLRLGELELAGRVVLVDCVTLWLTNLLFEAEVFAAGGADGGEVCGADGEVAGLGSGPDSGAEGLGGGPDGGVEEAPEAIAERVRAVAEEEFERLTAREATYIFVTNEVGLGGVAENRLARVFADLQGAVNQFIAARADEVTLVVSGIPVKIK